MSKVPNESKIPVRGKVQPTTKSFSRLASNISNKVRAHLTTESSKLRPASGTLLGFLSPGSRSKGSKRSLQRPSAFYQPLVSDWKPKTSMSENCSPIRETIDKNQIGRKVYVQGSKTGTLRYYGKTVIGEGNWCGVELDRPEGKNDGSVNNSRYFTCAPLHGLFLLETKVTLIPSVEPRPNSFLMTTGSADISPEEKASTSNSRPSSQISTPGSTGLPHFDLTLSSSVGSLIPKAQLPDRSLQSKHSSFEFDESLGILTPDQMSDFTLNCTLADQLPRTPSVDELSSFMLQDVTIDPVSETYLDVDETKLEPSISMETTECPTQERFSKEVSQEASESHSKKTSDISSSLRISKKEGFDFRQDRTPSLEDLPLDLSEDMKQDVTRKSVPPPNSFITSITSITSLDNGYQGDGEWSRPASRGPEHSPSAHQKVIKPKLDPMTDSDFFTESDADMHEECAGHRRAQVIDGTLYGGSGQPGSSSIGGNQIQRFSPTNEEMDSSGIFSDLEKKSEEPIWEKTNVIEDERNASPEGSIMTTSSKSDQSLKKISPTNFTLINERLDSIKNFLMNAEESDILPEIDEGVSEAKKARCSEPKQNNDPTPNKKFKMPKRNVVSKIKTMMTPPPVKTQEDTQENRNVRTPKKGRWDAVMNKIAQGQAQEKTTPKLKEVKSKVYCGITTQPNKTLPARPSTTPGACRKAASTRCLSTAQSISTRSLRDITTIKNKRYESRRNRIRSSESSLQGPVPGSQASSRNSSISDLSQPKPSTPRSNKKREARCCSSPQSDGSTNSSASHALKNARANQDQNLKNSTSPGKNAVGAEKVALNRKITPRRLNFPSKPQTLRDHNRVNSNGGKAENGFTFKNSPPSQGQTLPAAKIQRQPDPNALAAINHASKGAEALAILVNYLVHHVDAFSAPKLKKDLDNSNKELLKTKQDLDELHLMYNDLREEFNLEKKTHEEAFEEAYRGYEDEKNELSGKFKEEYNKLSQFHQEKLNEIREDFEAKEKFLKEKYEQEVDLLQKSHVENVENLKKRNAAETERIKKECSKAIAESNNREEKLKKKIEDLQTEFDHLKQKSDLFLSSAGKDAKLKVSIQQSNELQQEIDSLRSVLDLKSTELLELRRQSQMWRRDSEQLPATQYKVATLQAKVEDLQAQLEQKEAYEHQLEQEIGNLSMRVEKEATQQKRLSMHNEELMWKLKKNYEVVNAMAALSGASPIAAQKESNFPYSLSKTASEADIDLKRSFFGNETSSPPGSPKVKAIIEKNESVAWMLDMYDEPQCIASKILQRAQSVKTSSPPTPQTRGTKQRNRSSKSLTLTPSPLKMKSKSSPCTPEMRNSPEGDSWDEEHVTEEVIIVKSMGDRSVLELFDVDNSEIHIEDHPKKELSNEDIEMLRRVEQPGSRGEIILPKESAGEAMISGEASDDEEARDEDDLDSIQISTSDDDFSDHEIDSSLNDPDVKKEEFSNSLLKELENMY